MLRRRTVASGRIKHCSQASTRLGYGQTLIRVCEKKSGGHAFIAREELRPVVDHDDLFQRQLRYVGLATRFVDPLD